MKKKMKFNLILALTFLLNHAYAGVVASVKEVSGNVFTFEPNGETHVVQKGMVLNDLSELMTEDSAQVTIVNHLDQTIHLSSGTHIKFLNRILEVQNGTVWVLSKSNDSAVSVQTSNAKTNYNLAEFIMSYDNSSGKSQLFVINGEVEFSNMLENDLKYDVTTGKFSYISKDYENNTPREPTLIGFDSYKNLVSEFKGIKPQDIGFEKSLALNQKDSNRTIASAGGIEVEPTEEIKTIQQQPTNKGQIIYLRTVEGSVRAPASVLSSSEYYQKLKKQGQAKKELNKMVNKVEVKIHRPQLVESQRIPASHSSQIMQDLNNLDIAIESQKSPKSHTYPTEVNDLLRDLKNSR